MNKDHVASPGKFKVIGFDSFDRETYPIGQYDTLKEAKLHCVGGQMSIKYVHNDKGEIVYQNGSY